MNGKSQSDRKVSSVEVYAVRIPFLRPHRIAVGLAAGRDILIVRIKTSDGLIGIGEAIAHPGFSGETLGSLKAGVDCLAECVLGVNPMNLYRI
jgi:muconate cycloisomerase